jgi:prevent-host-death family protein
MLEQAGDVMRHIGAFEAKNRLSELLSLVENGEEVVITRHGKPVARLVAAEPVKRAAAHEAVQAIKSLRRGQTLGRIHLRDLIEAGRKY